MSPATDCGAPSSKQKSIKGYCEIGLDMRVAGEDILDMGGDGWGGVEGFEVRMTVEVVVLVVSETHV